MSKELLKILIVDDDEDDYIITRDLLSEVEGMRYGVEWAATYDTALETIGHNHHDVYLLDYRLGEHTGLELLQAAIKNGCKAPMILLTGQGDHEVDIEAMKAGAADYLVKGKLDTSLLERSIRYALDRKRVEEALLESQDELERKNRELKKAYTELKATQAKIFQQEKMASIGQLAAGVAHEINNPMGFISSNLGTLGNYVNKLTKFIQAQTEIVESIKEDGNTVAPVQNKGLLEAKRKELKLGYILDDIEELIKESLEGADRVKKIVQNLKSFSRLDEAEYQHADINECIESTLNIVWNELKYKAAVKKDFGEIPLTKCYPQQLNQVFMNLFVNAAHAIEKEGEIRIKTWNGDGSIFISISDTGHGIPEDKFDRIFEPFFTTKKAGKGTGLGLSITYDIVKKHNGEITVQSEVGKGTTFTTKIPVVEER